MGKMIEFPGPGGETIPAYLAISGSGPAPGVCIGQDIFGMSESLTAIADMFAANGFTAMVPDVFFDIEPATDVLPGGAERTSYINGIVTLIEVGRNGLQQCPFRLPRSRNPTH
jgi:dienelactone hydrolase